MSEMCVNVRISANGGKFVIRRVYVTTILKNSNLILSHWLCCRTKTDRWTNVFKMLTLMLNSLMTVFDIFS